MSTPTRLDAPDGADEDATGDVGLALVFDERPVERAVERPVAADTVDDDGHRADPENDPEDDRKADDEDGPRTNRRGGWTPLVLTMLARAALFALASLVLWSAVPAVLGWQPTVVVSGSMEPRIGVGDVVISRPVPSSQVAVGRVLLVDDPDRPGELRLHRLARITPDGLILRGDANQTNDSTPVKRSAVHGAAVLRVPWIGEPMMWMRNGQYLLVGIALALLLLLFRVATWWRPEVKDHTDDEDVAPAEPVSVTPAPSRRGRGRHRRRRRFAVAAIGGVIVLLGSGVVPQPGFTASAKFVKTTANPTNTWAAAASFGTSCATALGASGTGAALAWPLTDASRQTISDASGNSRTGTYTASGVTYGTAGPCPRDGAKSITVDGSAGYAYGNTTFTNPQLFTVSAWFKTTGTRGEIVGFHSTQTGVAPDHDRTIYMTTGGKVAFGVYAGAYKVITSPSTYNDGQWHFVAASVAPSGNANPGQRLYIDGSLVVSDTAVTSAEAGGPYYLRAGYGDLNGWTGSASPYFFTGSLAFPAVHLKALTPAEVTTLNNAGR